MDDKVNKGTGMQQFTLWKHLFLLPCLLFLSFFSHAQFSLEQIPQLNNKKSITLVAETGFWTQYLQQSMLPKFTKKTGVTVHVTSVTLDEMFKLQQQGLSSGTGQYDLLSMEPVGPKIGPPMAIPFP